MKKKEPIKTFSAGGVVLNKNKEVLIVSQFGTAWSLPKGHLDNDEDHITAAKREIYEESGVSELNLIKELGSYERFKMDEKAQDDESELKNILIYLFETTQIDLKPIDPENPEARWVKKEDVQTWLTHPKDKEFFMKVINLIP